MRSIDTYVAFLDVQKAYDTVWRDGVFDSLLRCGIHGKMWRVIRDMYRSVGNRVRVNGILTEITHFLNLGTIE